VTNPSRKELGDFLRSRRERLSPEAVGLKSARRRRTPGLRREEVAELADIGVDWYVRLEQGREVNPSSATIEALARALRLDKVEMAHLRALALNSGRRTFSREIVPEAIRRLLESLDQPAYVTGRRWDILAWNDATADLFKNFTDVDEEDRNVLVYLLLDPDSKRLFGTAWKDEARRVLAQFRAEHDFWAKDAAFLALLERLRRGSPEFETWWEAHDVRKGLAGQKLLSHPQKGLLRFEYVSFQANDDPALRLVIYTPV